MEVGVYRVIRCASNKEPSMMGERVLGAARCRASCWKSGLFGRDDVSMGQSLGVGESRLARWCCMLRCINHAVEI